MFFEKLHTAMEMNTPIKANSTSKKNIYMTNRAMRLKSKKRRLWIRYLARRLWIGYLASKSRCDRNNYIKCKNDLRKLTRKLRRDYEQVLTRIAKSVLEVCKVKVKNQTTNSIAIKTRRIKSIYFQR